ncbi:citrate (Si)-synthase [Tessaracoccus lapidicaptus]|uniref:Citrate synthase n=1 Tax=Tessaracoccus lapidicaptus TaxID=1427523 RepID=A0A1C0AK64_9ACTN|nr:MULTISPECIES: citrate synthase [Tessaracoccus]AQX16935.1 citrate (Si)-synthase [Tessaracoccus sp. T2.5-30]OCL33005.1 citrate (Si)-synthase [Tessaracoccus lapidicaptus]VEP41758.1 Citrate synthase 1 [Tessaracoccus lapidicaptus]
MGETATIIIDGTSYELPVVTGTEGERAIDISSLRSTTGLITLDDGYGNTGSCQSAITFIDGEKGILRYRGIPIEDLAERSSFIETAELLIFGELPDEEERTEFRHLLSENAALHRDMRKHFDGFPADAHPMAILSAMINALQTHELHDIETTDAAHFKYAAAGLIAKTRTIAAASYKSHIGQPIAYPRYDLNYAENFLHMMFSVPYRDYEPTPEVAHALNMFLVLHADHEQNCSTSTVRMVASSGANMYSSVSAGVNALWGRLHGGANMAVIEMLEHIRTTGITPEAYLARVKDRSSGVKLMGFGHRVYRNFDPRARILKDAADKLLDAMHVTDPLLDIAREVEQAALADDYFASRRLYPNVDFYSGIILRAIGIPLDMFTVMFAIGRTPGWIAHWKEVTDNPRQRIYRPRQVYVGNPLSQWVPRSER